MTVGRETVVVVVVVYNINDGASVSVYKRRVQRHISLVLVLGMVVVCALYDCDCSLRSAAKCCSRVI